MAFELEKEHLEKVKAQRAEENGTGGLREALERRLAREIADARQAAARYDAASELLRLTRRNPDTERIIELAQMLRFA
jgi:hypothetical protein